MLYSSYAVCHFELLQKPGDAISEHACEHPVHAGRGRCDDLHHAHRLLRLGQEDRILRIHLAARGSGDDERHQGHRPLPPPVHSASRSACRPCRDGDRLFLPIRTHHGSRRLLPRPCTQEQKQMGHGRSDRAGPLPSPVWSRGSAKTATGSSHSRLRSRS